MRARRTCGGKVDDGDGGDGGDGGPRRNCPALADGADGLCAAHRVEYEARRGTATQRHYGADHRRIRAALLRRLWRLSPQERVCPVCGDVMVRSDDLEAEHSRPLVKDPTAKADRIVHARCNPRGGAGLR